MKFSFKKGTIDESNDVEGNEDKAKNSERLRKQRVLYPAPDVYKELICHQKTIF